MLAKLNPNAELYFPSSVSNEANLELTTHLGIGAHQDDLEIIAIHGILVAYDHPEKYFTGVTVTDGRGAPRSGPYQGVSDDDLWKVRRDEQKKAAQLGNYHAQYLLNFPSKMVKSPGQKTVIEDFKQIIKATKPAVIYTHNLADKHDTHVGLVLCVIQALRELKAPPNFRKIYGCEAWRDLDWLVGDDKIPLDVSNHPDLQEALLTVFESQISGGKRYDLAAIGRRQANATFDKSHEIDQTTHTVYAMDLTPLIHHPEIEIEHFVSQYTNNMANDVKERLNRLRKDSV